MVYYNHYLLRNIESFRGLVTAKPNVHFEMALKYMWPVLSITQGFDVLLIELLCLASADLIN